MSAHLKKLGLSDTKFQLKYHTPKCSNVREAPSSSKKQPQPPQRTIPTQEQPSILRVLVQLLSRKQRQTCPLPDHDRNMTKFLCLDDNCPSRIGCSYCFLDGHIGHPKVQTRACLRDLQELQGKTQTSRELLRTQLMIRKQELLGKLEAEVGSIREEFMANLDYMSRKIKESIEARFEQSTKSLINAPKETVINQQPSMERDSPIRYNNHANDDDLISSFMLSASKHSESKPPIRSITQYPLRRQSFPPSKISLSRQQQHGLLSKLSRLNLTYVQQYLKHQTVHLRQVMSGFRIYEQFYTELSSSLGEFFSAFKRALPTLKPSEISLQQPQILQAFPRGAS